MTPLAWLGILAILLVIEAITVGLTTVWFAGGALVACIVSWLGGGIVVQLLLFFGVSVVLLIFTRPLAVRYMNKGVEKTNAESLLGKSLRDKHLKNPVFRCFQEHLPAFCHKKSLFSSGFCLLVQLHDIFYFCI